MQRDTKKSSRDQYKALRAAITNAINRADPVGLLDLGAPQDEYDPEVGTILPRLSTASSANDVLTIVHEEFVRWFGTDNAGPADAYREAAEEIWRIVRDSTSRQTSSGRPSD